MTQVLFNAKITDKFVELTDQLGTTKNVSHYDFYKTFAETMGIFQNIQQIKGKEEIMSLGAVIRRYPDSFFYEISNGDNRTMFLYHKEGPHRVPFDLVENYTRYPKDLTYAGMSNEQVEVKLRELGVFRDKHVVYFEHMMMPNILCKINLRRLKKNSAADEDTWSVSNVNYGWTDLPSSQLKIDKGVDTIQKLGPVLRGGLPFPNVHGDAGTICYGNNTTVTNVTDAKLTDLESYIRFITSIPYNMHIVGQGNVYVGGVKTIAEGYDYRKHFIPEGVDKTDGLYKLKYHASEHEHEVLNWFFYLNSITKFPYHFFK